ncbi:hypothetical protein GCM10027164_03460 [Algoriphagus taiwanensis]
MAKQIKSAMEMIFLKAGSMKLKIEVFFSDRKIKASKILAINSLFGEGEKFQSIILNSLNQIK